MPSVAVLAGGLATRMHPRTLTVPKSMLEVRGRPFVDWQLEKLAACGFDRVVMCVAHLGGVIREHVGDGRRFGLHVDYSEEGPQLLGTGGALREAVAQGLLPETFVVTYGDSWLPFDYAEPLRVLGAHDDCDLVMAVYQNHGKYDPSNVRTDGARVLAYEKGAKDPAFDHIDYGAMAVRRSAVEARPRGVKWGLDELQRDLARAGRVRAVVVKERFYEIGSPEGLATLEARLDEPARMNEKETR
jgi:NDP-sugar pyrophosphorylase family protein